MIIVISLSFLLLQKHLSLVFQQIISPSCYLCYSNGSTACTHPINQSINICPRTSFHCCHCCHKIYLLNDFVLCICLTQQAARTHAQEPLFTVFFIDFHFGHLCTGIPWTAFVIVFAFVIHCLCLCHCLCRCLCLNPSPQFNFSSLSPVIALSC